MKLDLTPTGMRCLGCSTDVRVADVVCRKCGDRVKPRDPVSRALAEHLPEIGKAVTKFFEDVDAPVIRRSSRSAPADNPPLETGKVTGVTLTPQQDRAVEAVRGWYFGCMTEVSAEQPYGPRKPFRLFGPAGTGKTTIVRHIEQALGVHAVFGAYTGKAAHVLRKKGVPATTIHSAVYHPVDNYEVRAEWRRLTDELAEVTEAYTESVSYPGGGSPDVWAPLFAQKEDLEIKIEALEATMRRPSFEFNPHSEWADADLIVLDEVSMVNANMAADIERYGVPVLVLGDPAQLPPIEGGGHYTNATPDVLLTEVHRQALESPVLALATAVRLGQGWRDQLVKVNLAEAMEADQIICWKNSTRWNLIDKIRAKLGRPKGMPVPGDRIMCLVNNKDAGVFNGAQFEVLEVRPGDGDLMLHVRDDEGNERELCAFLDGFQGLEAEKLGKSTLRAFRGKRGLFTFANSITVHKAQGSEWDSVYLVDQTHLMSRSSEAEKRAWAYTGITRASERVTIASTNI